MGLCQSIQDKQKKTNQETNSTKNSSSIKQFTEIEINMKQNDKEILKRKYTRETRFSEIIEDLKKEASNKKEMKDIIKNQSVYRFRDIIIDHSKSLKDYLSSSEKSISINVEIVGLKDIPDDTDSYIIDKINLIGKLDYNPFKLYIFNKTTNLLQKVNFPEYYKKEFEIDNVSKNSSYCNGINKLYIFGGNSNKDIISTFWIIDLESINVRKIYSQIHPRTHHSLIFIPSKYVFIIGGKDIKSVYYFDINSQKFIQYAFIEDILIEPALILINNQILYAMSNIGKNFLMYKSNLGEKAKWEKIIPEIPENLIFTQKFFAVSKSDNNSFIFIGGNHLNDEKDNYVFEYNYNKNELTQSTLIHEDFNFTEKSFIPFNDSSYALFSNEMKKKFRIVFYNKGVNVIETLDFEGEFIKKKIINESLKPSFLNQKNEDFPCFSNKLVESKLIDDINLNFNMPNLNIQENDINGYYYSSIPTYFIDKNKKMYTNEKNFVTQTPKENNQISLNDNLDEINTNKKKNDNKESMNHIDNYNKIFINYEHDDNNNYNKDGCFPLNNNNNKQNNELFGSSIFNEIGKNYIGQYKNTENNDKKKNDIELSYNNGFSLFN